MTKDGRVDFNILAEVGGVIAKCCPAMRNLRAVRSVRCLPDGGAERGYTLESHECLCPSRWLAFDWRKGDAVFQTRGAV